MDRDDNDAAIVLVKTYGEVQMGAGKSCCVAQSEHFHENIPRKVAERTIHTSSGHVHNYIGGDSGNVFHKVLKLCAILHALKIFRTILIQGNNSTCALIFPLAIFSSILSNIAWRLEKIDTKKFFQSSDLAKCFSMKILLSA